MAEEFLDEIYRQAILIEELKEIQEAAYRRWMEHTAVLWNSCVSKLAEVAKLWEEEEPGEGKQFLEILYRTTETYRDENLFAANISRSIIPQMFRYMSRYAGIDVTEGRFSFQSADSGFLTVYDQNLNLYYHNVEDPLWEAHILAQSVYQPDQEEFHLFGVGLGYLAYAIFKLSGGATPIYLYETDEKMIEYAFHYGVLEWVPEDVLHIIFMKNGKEAVTRYQEIADRTAAGHFMMKWMGCALREEGYPELDQSRMGEDTLRWFQKQNITNLWKNKKRATMKVSELCKHLKAEEWIVVAAGPSVDDRMGILRNLPDTCKLVAVDAVLKKLVEANIHVDLVVAADPKDQLRRYLNGIENETVGIPLLASRLTNWKYTEAYQGDVCLMTPANIRMDYEIPECEADEEWDIGGTVSSLAIEAAVRFGARRIRMIGLDLAYPDGVTYAKGITDASKGQEDMKWTESVTGKRVQTTETFLFFKQQIELQISQYSNVEFINLSTGGANISGTRIECKLSEVF